MITVTDLALVRLLHLVSPALPIGMYSYSQGLESAVGDGWVHDERTLGEWLQGQLDVGLLHVDIPLLGRLYTAFATHNDAQARHWSDELLACRETAELRAEDRHGGQALCKLLTHLGLEHAAAWQRGSHTTLAAGFALAAHAWAIAREQAALGYLWAWLENQILSAQKLLPLGQSAGQRLLHDLSLLLPERVAWGLQLDDAAMGGSTVGLALASSRHEVQYCRLFRS